MSIFFNFLVEARSIQPVAGGVSQREAHSWLEAGEKANLKPMRKPRQNGDLKKWPLRAAPPCWCGKPKAPASKRTCWHARHMQTASPQRHRSLYLPARRLPPARVPPRGAAGIVCHEAAAGSIHWAESPAALNQPPPPPVLTSAFVAIGCMAVERIGATSCAERAMSSARSGSVCKQSAKFQASAARAAARESRLRTDCCDGVAHDGARARREGVTT